MSVIIELPANQSEVQKHWDTTMIGKMGKVNFMDRKHFDCQPGQT